MAFGNQNVPHAFGGALQRNPLKPRTRPPPVPIWPALGLIPAAVLTDAGYRQYGDADVHTLRFVRHARELGFSIAEIGELVGFWHNRKRPSCQLKALAQAHIQELDQKAQELLAMKATLEHLVHCCHGEDRPDCPILETLASDSPDSAPTVRKGAKFQQGRGKVDPSPEWRCERGSTESQGGQGHT